MSTRRSSPMLASQSGRLNGTVNYTSTIPAEAIDGASKIAASSGKAETHP